MCGFINVFTFLLLFTFNCCSSPNYSLYFPLINVEMVAQIIGTMTGLKKSYKERRIDKYMATDKIVEESLL